MTAVNANRRFYCICHIDCFSFEIITKET